MSVAARALVYKTLNRRNAMIETLIGLLIAVLIIGLLWWAAQSIIAVVPLPEPFRTIVYVLLIVILVLICIFYILIPLLHMIPTHLNMR